MTTGLAPRFHFFAREPARAPLAALFRHTLGVDVSDLQAGANAPMLLMRFADGSSCSVEFTDLAPESAAAVNDALAPRGAWLELVTTNAAALGQRLAAAGFPYVRHTGSENDYLSAPGGQVFRIAVEPARGAARGAVSGLGRRVHLFAQPSARPALTTMFKDLFGAVVAERDFGLAYPILVAAFGNGSLISVEFTDAAPRAPGVHEIDDRRALRGAWIEFRTTDVAAMERRLSAAGLPSFHHADTPFTYFSGPNGQVFRLAGTG